MSRVVRLAAAFAALALAPPSTSAQTVEEKNLTAGKVKYDPEKGYIFISGAGRSNGMFLRVPDDATREAHQKDWEEAFAKAQTKHAKALKNWEESVRIAKQTNKKPPPRPVEPSRETFSIGSIELRDAISYGPMFVFNKAEDRFTYLNAVKPGTYIYYGPIFFDPNVGVAGQCYCMGTVRFEVKKGTITDLGNSLGALPRIEPPYDITAQMWLKANEERAAKGKPPVYAPPILAYGLPESLKSWPNEQAELHASGKLNNFYNLPITRMAPIPRILGYRRDTPIDLRTGQDVPSPPIRTQVKIKK